MTDTPLSSTQEQTVLATWDAPILPRHERSRKWYMWGGGIVVAGAVYGILIGSWALTLVIVLCGAMYYLLRDHVPPSKTIVITNNGVLLEEVFTRWEDMKGFWILQTPGYTELHFVPVSKRRSDILIQTGEQNIEQLRMLIGTHISELTDKHENVLDAFIRIAKL